MPLPVLSQISSQGAGPDAPREMNLFRMPADAGVGLGPVEQGHIVP